jgi:BlaI family transcriptional regulator, penicillinase repressor
LFVTTTAEETMEEPTPSTRELEILKVLWELGSASVRQVRERMCPNDERAFTTVQTLLRIMDDKGLVSHKAQGRSFVYAPRYSRERATSRFLTQVFDGALDQVVVSMLSTTDASPEELKQLEKIIARTRRGKERQRRQK